MRRTKAKRLVEAVERIDPNSPARQAFLEEVKNRQAKSMMDNHFILSAKAIDILANKRASSFSEALGMVIRQQRENRL